MFVVVAVGTACSSLRVITHLHTNRKKSVSLIIMTMFLSLSLFFSFFPFSLSLSLSLSVQAWKVNFISIFYFVHIISGNLNSYSLLCSSGVYFFILILGTVTGSMKAFVGFLFCFCFSRGFRSLFHTLSR